MNPDLEDKRIKALFQELKQDDARRAPPFSAMHHTAAIAARQSPRLLTIKLAVALVMLALILGGTFYVVRRALSVPAEQQKIVAGQEDSGTPNNNLRFDSERKQELPTQLPRIVSTVPPGNPRRVAHRPARHGRHEHALISEWRSPTDFLLKVPGEDWLTRVPRLGEPVIDLFPTPSDRRN